MNIYWFEFFLTVMQGNGNIEDTGGRGEGGGGAGMGGEELGKQLSFIIVIGVQKSCLST